MHPETGEHANLLATYSTHIQRMRRSLAILVLVCCLCTPARGHPKEHGTVCRYWCRTSDHRYYCCPSGKQDWHGHGWHTIFYPWLWIGAAAGGVADQLSPFLSHWPEVSVTERETKKHCPPLRTHCPRTYDWYTPPNSCDSDSDCGKSEKCCYDVCLEHKTCKLSEWEK
ncbi:uncharacterized protein LOC143354639 [Halictus rubicundus]|uniref:uncharacterized protein LOC143354639 n=1 Tax=Halictus rubicundus TaxID=77578 RepID=UPI0040375337